MLDTRERIIDVISRTGHKEGLKLLRLEENFGIEFNVAQLQSVVNRAWGKSYLSYAYALDRAINTNMTVSRYDAQLLDEDVGHKHRAIKQWFNGFKEFAYNQGFNVVRLDDFTVKVVAK